jgi:hypothetical protein
VAKVKFSPPGSAPRSVIEYCCPGDAGCPEAWPVPIDTAATTAKRIAIHIVRFIVYSPYCAS